MSLEHSIPSGDWFEFVSSPHLLCESLMYLSLSLILFGNYTWLFVFFWVLSNQVTTHYCYAIINIFTMSHNILLLYFIISVSQNQEILIMASLTSVKSLL